MKTRKPTKELGNATTRLHLRLLFRDRRGTVRDTTHDDDEYGYGLKRLVREGDDAVEGLRRVTELFQLLALAAEDREQIEAALVRRVFDELEHELSRSGGLGSYVEFTHRLFEQAEALPPLGGDAMRKAGRALALLTDAG